MSTENLTQIPTDDELFEYLVGNLRRSAVAWHLEDSEFRPDLFDPGFVASLRAFSAIGGGELVDRLIDTLFDALRRLNELPRTEELWSGTNGKPTLFKLRDHAAMVLGSNPGDSLALWTKIALSIVHGSSNFGAKQWRRLHHEGLDDVRWPILAALVTELNAAPTGNELVELIGRTERTAAARAYLSTFDACGDPWILQWRDDILGVLEAN